MAQGAQDQLMKVADVISAMGISRSTWQKLVAQKQTPPIVRIGAVQLIMETDVEGLIGAGRHERSGERTTWRNGYPSQREDAGDRAARRAHRIRDCMGWPGGVLEGSGWGKPKGMHWRTYERLCEEHDTFEDVVNRSFIARFGPMLEKGGF